ncbi:glutathione S-transferase N-terminal domain-containing protein [Celeribacter halophilus]|uniref:glutathione S-transferase N-terminal domain-containing protein n=1 Tax=Celeribacter halophilus TaxID=576117 RepID=UPI001C085094|nr:glutathione S-transferase N-terminal domain-containing protein [Celeribacter halophilus]MBU2889711.1 glutathione S-transferase N-terminal domain-containing protein [Celeribacter halophilus]MDO6510646.1 glutathione S-transferase N-terminal domain-containing protein [Celeribacter halophilus]
MSNTVNHPITKRWPAQFPDKIQLYSFPTPNGVKASIALEEMGLDYEPHLVTLSDSDVKSPEFLALNPNNKIPAIIDPNGPDGAQIELFESGAILIYLAEKTGKFLPTDSKARYETLQWLMFQMGGVGPMFGQLGFFYKFAGAKMEDPTARNRYINEAKRLLNVLEQRLEGRDWIMDSYSIADMAIAPWLNALDFYGAKEVLGYNDLKNVPAYVERFYARPAVAKAKNIPPRPE